MRMKFDVELKGTVSVMGVKNLEALLEYVVPSSVHSSSMTSCVKRPKGAISDLSRFGIGTYLIFSFEMTMLYGNLRAYEIATRRSIP